MNYLVQLRRRARARHLCRCLDNQLLEALDAEIAVLPVSYQVPLVLCRLQGCSVRQAAQLLGRAPCLVRRELYRGCRLLRCRLAERGLPLLSGKKLARLLRRAVPGEERLLVKAARNALESEAAWSPGVRRLVDALQQFTL